MTRGITARLLRTVEIAYAVTTLFLLTQGPVLRLWRPSEKLLESLPNPSVAHAHFATFVAVQLPAVALFARRIDVGWLRDRGNQALFALLCWLGLSVTWSTFARQSAPEYVALVLTTLFGLYLATSFNGLEFWLVVASAMALGVGISWLAIMRLWDAAVNFQEDYWVGIYYNRNSFAPVTAVAILAALGLVISVFPRSGRKRPLMELSIFLLTAILIGLAAVELWKTKSQTSPSALVIAAVVSAAWLLLSQIFKRLRAPFAGVLSRVSLPVALIVVALVVFFVLRFEVGVGGSQTQTTAFNQRSGLWSLSWSGIVAKPWHGWGWLAAWHTPLFFLSSKEPSWMSWGLEWSHNGYHDLLLGGGVPAALFFVSYVWFSSKRLGTSALKSAIPRLLLAAFVLSAATQESFFIGSHFLWALLVASLANQSGRETSVNK